MDVDKLRSDIKAYALELMKETSTSGGAGAYLTKLKEEQNNQSRMKFKISKSESKLEEARYSQFRKTTETRSPREQLHKAVREIQIKMDEVNKLVEFTSRMKQELKESDEELKYLKRTHNSLHKIQEKIQYISNKIKTITE